MAVPCVLHSSVRRANVWRNLVSTDTYHAKNKWFGGLMSGLLSLCGRSHRRSFPPPMGSVQVTGPFVPSLYTWRCPQRSWIITSCISRCRLAAGFVVSKTKDGGFCLLGLAATCTFSCNILYKRTVGANLCLSPGSPRRYHSHRVAVHFRRCSPGLGRLYCRVNLTWLFHTGLFLWRLICCN